jgi:hypothetical protein
MNEQTKPTEQRKTEARKTAIYFNPEGLADVLCFVLNENEDGTVDLCDKKGRLLIGSCPVFKGPGKLEGHCRIEPRL